MDMIPEEMAAFDPIPLQPLLRLRRCHERITFEEHVRKKTIRLVTLIKPEIILYTTAGQPGLVFCLELSMNKKPNIGKQGGVFHYRSTVVAILNLSYEHRVRVGILLSDNTMPIIMIDQNFHWQNKGQIRGVMFDLERAHLMVYSRTSNALFWPLPRKNIDDDGVDGEIKWDVQMCNVNIRKQMTILRGLPEMELQALKDELVILFRRHGVLFLDYKQLRPLVQNQSGPGPRFYTNRYDRYNDYRSGCMDRHDRIHLERGDQGKGEGPAEIVDLPEMASPMDNDSAIDSNLSDSFMSSADVLTLEGIHWSPDMMKFDHIKDLSDFKPKRTDVELRGHCHSKDQKKHFDRKTNNDEVKRVIALYGNVVYKLTPHICAPLTTIRVPSDLVEPFQLMFLSRIVVVYNNQTIAGYMNSSTPVKVRKGNFLLAGYGIIVDENGIFRIKMSLPKAFENEE